MRMRRLIHTSRVLLNRNYFDLIGNNAVDTKSLTVIQNLNACVDVLSSGRNDCVDLLKESLIEDPQCKTSHILMTFALLRQADASNCSDIETLLQKLGVAAKKGLLSKRDKLLSAASFHWFHGRYVRAAALLESAVQQGTFPEDVLGLRLAQDCYLLANSPENVLGCVTRHSESVAGHPTISGLYAIGLIENNQISAAEECSTRAVEKSKGKSILPLYSLLASHQLTGTSSVAINFANRYAEYHKGIGINLLLFNKGSSQVLRGQYSGAYRTAWNMLEALRHEFDPEKVPVPRGYLNHCIMLVWYSFINSPKELNYRVALDIIKAALREGSFPASQDVVSDVTTSILIALIEHMVRTPSRLSRVQSSTQQQPKSVWNSMKAALNPGYSRANDPDADAKEKAEAEGIARDLKELEGLLAQLKASHEKTLQFSSLSRVSVPDLEAVEPTVTTVRHFNNWQDIRQSDLDMSRQKCSLVLHNALVMFGAGNAIEAEKLIRSHGDLWSYLGGGSSLIRDIVMQTHIEMAIQSGDLNSAMLMLRERNKLYPSDAHTLRRLSVVLAAQGNHHTAQSAAYTAYQLGLGQHGLASKESTL